MPTEHQDSGVPTASEHMPSYTAPVPRWHRWWYPSMWIATGLFILIAITGQILLTVPAFNFPITSIGRVAVTPDGKRALTIAYGESLTLWDLASGNTPLEQHVLTTYFSPDGQSVLTNDGRLWDTDAGKVYKALMLPEAYGGGAFSPDGKYVLITTDLTVKLWDVTSGQVIRTFCCLPSTADDRIVAYSPDGNSHDAKNAVVVTYNGSVSVWDTATGAHLRTFEMGDDHPLGNAISADGTYILHVGSNNPPQLWDVAAGSVLPIPIMSGWTNENQGIDVTFAGDDQHVLSAMDDGTAILWDIRTGTALRTFGFPNLSWVAERILVPWLGYIFVATAFFSVAVVIVGIEIRHSLLKPVGWKYWVPWIFMVAAGITAFIIGAQIALRHLVI